jgi:hypothetical protein
MMPPQNDLQRQWAPRLQRSLPDYRVVVLETEAEARHELIDADAAYGWVPPDALPAATKLRWLQNPQAGPAPGYYYPAWTLPVHAGCRALHGVTVMVPREQHPWACPVRRVLPFPVPSPGRRTLRHSAPRSRSLRKKSSRSCINCSGLKASSRCGCGASSTVVS